VARWQISNYYKKNVVDRQFWHNNDREFVRDEGYRWGTWECESEERPDIDLDNPDGYELTATEYDWDLVDMLDGSWSEWTYDTSFDQEEKDQLEAAWDELGYEGLENLDYMMNESEQWIYGPILLKNLDTGEEWHGKE
jgi:hypothetical protein